MYFITTIEETLVERLVRLFRDNIWKLHSLSKSEYQIEDPNH